MKLVPFFIVLLAAVSLFAGCTAPTAPPIDYHQAYIDAQVTLVRQAEDPLPKNPEHDAAINTIRSNALESLAATNATGAGTILMQALRDEDPMIKFAAAMGLGDICYKPALPLLRDMAKDCSINPKVLAGVVYAMHRMGDDSSTGELGRLLYQDDKWIRGTAILVMGKMGEPGAIPHLRTIQDEDKRDIVQLQSVEALALLGDERSIRQLEAWTKSPGVEDRIVAVEAMGKINHPRSIAMLTAIYNDGRQDPIVRVTAAGSLAELCRPCGYERVLQAATDPCTVLKTVRGANAQISPVDIRTLQIEAILALGKLGNPCAIAPLHDMLGSPDGAVRVAAARSILLLLPSYRGQVGVGVEAGVRPMPAAGGVLPVPAPAPASTTLIEEGTLLPTTTSAPAASQPTSAPSAGGDELSPSANPGRPVLKTAGAKD